MSYSQTRSHRIFALAVMVALVLSGTAIQAKPPQPAPLNATVEVLNNTWFKLSCEVTPKIDNTTLGMISYPAFGPQANGGVRECSPTYNARGAGNIGAHVKVTITIDAQPTRTLSISITEVATS